MNSNGKKTALVVLGMHRSGTSALTGVLKLAGVDLGDSLLAGTEENKKGFFEDLIITNIQQQILGMAGSSWDDPRFTSVDLHCNAGIMALVDDLKKYIESKFSQKPLWGFKDPRTCRLLSIWFPIFSVINCEPVMIIMIRHPAEVTRSLSRRNNMSDQKAYLLWLQHYLLAEKETRGKRRIFMTYDDLLSKPHEILAKISATLGFRLPQIENRAAIDAFLDSDLRHQTVQNQVKLPELVSNAYECLKRAASEGGEPDCERLDSFKLEFVKFMDSTEPSAVNGANDLVRIQALCIQQARDVIYLSNLRNESASVIQSKDAAISQLQSQLAEANELIRNLSAELNLLKSTHDEKLRESYKAIQELRAEREKILAGFSFRLGRWLTSPLRLLKR